MSMKPILFNTEMVRALLDGSKTVTRRVVKPKPIYMEKNPRRHGDDNFYFELGENSVIGPYKPPYHIGDTLYVRETWGTSWNTSGGTVGKVVYKADSDIIFPTLSGKWYPSIHMPKEHARIFLRVIDVRAERLQDISERQAIAEGFVAKPINSTYINFNCSGTALRGSAREKFWFFWEKTISKENHNSYGWRANPWVWVIEFEKISKEEAM